LGKIGAKIITQFLIHRNLTNKNTFKPKSLYLVIQLNHKLKAVYKTILISLCCSLFFLTSVNAQKYKGQRFKVGALVAANAAQIDGDKIFGYGKFGAQAGIQCIAMINKKQYLSLEFLISQRGAVTSPEDIGSRRTGALDIRLNYVEVPLLYNLKSPFGNSKFGTYFYTGLSVSRLLGGTISGTNVPNIANPVLLLKDRISEFTTFEIDYIIGVNYFFNKNWGLTVRHTVGLTQFFVPAEVDILDEIKPLRNLFITIGGVYILN
jgi:hypothetical protein